MQKMAAKICYVFEKLFSFATDRGNIAMWLMAEIYLSKVGT